MTVRAAREIHFATGGYSEAGYTAKFFRVKVGPWGFWLPNPPARSKAIAYHDLNHVLTGYDTSWYGEAEIAAWELSSGCTSVPIAFAINVGVMAIGMIISPRRTMTAFRRGRRSLNAYGMPIMPLLDRTVDEVRKELMLDS